MTTQLIGWNSNFAQYRQRSFSYWALGLLAMGILYPAGASVLAAPAPDTNTRSLGVGDPAPALKVGAWIQGEPVTEFAPDKVYLVEFWATWCGPCVQSIPHLNEIAATFAGKGLVVIGQNVSEPNESKVKPFVAKMGDKMTYRVALDDKTNIPKGAMAETWLNASGAAGIPTAFLVGKDGRIAWIGHPLGLEASVIEQVLAGSYDVERAASSFRRKAEVGSLAQEIEGHYRAGRWDEADAALDAASKLVSPEPPDIVMLRARIGFQRLAVRLEQQLSKKAWDQAEVTVGQLSQLVFPEEQREEAEKEIESVVLKARLLILLGRRDWDAAEAHAKRLPPADVIAVVQEAIGLTEDAQASERLRRMLERLAAAPLPAETIIAEAFLIAVPNREALALAAKSEAGGVSGVSLADLQKLAADDKARSEGTVSVTSAPGIRAIAEQGKTRLDFALTSRGDRISGPLVLDHGGANITTTISAKSGDLIYLGSFTGEGETCMAFLKLTLAGGGRDSAN